MSPQAPPTAPRASQVLVEHEFKIFSSRYRFLCKSCFPKMLLVPSVEKYHTTEVCVMVLFRISKTPDYILTHFGCVPAGTRVNSVIGFREFVSLILVVENQILWPSFIGVTQPSSPKNGFSYVKTPIFRLNRVVSPQ